MYRENLSDCFDSLVPNPAPEASLCIGKTCLIVLTL